VSSEVRNLHDIEQGGLHEVHIPRLGDYLRIIPLSPSQVVMWGENVVNFAISKVEVSKLQHRNIILVCSDYVYPLREVRSDQGVFKIFGHVVSIYYATQGGI
jgi:hypothetical protein